MIKKINKIIIYCLALIILVSSASAVEYLAWWDMTSISEESGSYDLTIGLAFMSSIVP